MTKRALVRLQVIKVYDVEVQVPDTYDEFDAEDTTYDLNTLWIAEHGKLIDVETDHHEFQEWIRD